jgi:diaminohydroxyphosphoribosylaminopyrimidine deaminase/5-amino-6-(5-phosphoribosylamino)uracil reductase
VDRLQIFSSPQILGSDAVPAFRGMSLPVRLAEAEVERFGEDLGISGLLRDPWAAH